MWSTWMLVDGPERMESFAIKIDVKDQIRILQKRTQL